MSFDADRARGIEVPPAHALTATLEETRAATLDLRLTPLQVADLIAIRDAWNADRHARHLAGYVLEDVLSRVLRTTAYLLKGT